MAPGFRALTPRGCMVPGFRTLTPYGCTVLYSWRYRQSLQRMFGSSAMSSSGSVGGNSKNGQRSAGWPGAYPEAKRTLFSDLSHYSITDTSNLVVGELGL